MNNFLNFMRESTSMYHACKNVEDILIKNGFIELSLDELWHLEFGKNYYLKSDESSIIAFKIPYHKSLNGLNLCASHLDSPTFKIKPNPNLLNDAYLRLNVEPYGSPILSTWLDKPLSISGRVVINDNNKLVSKLLYIDQDLLIIPNNPPHLDPSVKSNKQYNENIDLKPLLGLSGAYDLKTIIAKELKISEDMIVDYDLYLVNRQRAKLGGYNDELVFSPQLDDLASAYTSLMAFIAPSNNFNFYLAFNNEEIGSMTTSGAFSNYFMNNLYRILTNLGYTQEEQQVIIANSFLLSCDNAHAVSPNHPELFDQNNRVYLGKGVVLKYNANMKYVTNSISSSYLQMIANSLKLNLQKYTNRSDLRGGSTLGSLLINSVPIKACDIGLAQLAMHSSYEVCATKDLNDMINLIKGFYNTYYNKTRA